MLDNTVCQTFFVVIFGFVYLNCDMFVQFFHQYSFFSLSDSSKMRIQKNFRRQNDKFSTFPVKLIIIALLNDMKLQILIFRTSKGI
jgi:hypothetical protein